MKTPVLLNLYDLSPANDCLFNVGLGLHHSGIEVNGTEYSFGSGGAGIFESPPRVAPGAKFRQQIELGSYDGGSRELQQALDDLRSDFGAGDYNLIKKNCNHFANALSWKLLQKTIPGYVNRIAEVGNLCSCLLSQQMLQDAPVGGSASQQSTSSSTMFAPIRQRMETSGTSSSSNSKPNTPAFSGTGHSLSGGTSSASETRGLLSRFTTTSHKNSSTTTATTSGGRQEDLTDRREKARMAALKRLEQQQQQAVQSSSNVDKQS